MAEKCWLSLDSARRITSCLRYLCGIIFVWQGILDRSWGCMCGLGALFNGQVYGFQFERGNLFIIHDKSHDDILQQLKARKNRSGRAS